MPFHLTILYSKVLSDARFFAEFIEIILENKLTNMYLLLIKGVVVAMHAAWLSVLVEERLADGVDPDHVDFQIVNDRRAALL